MRTHVKSSATYAPDSSFLSRLSGWAQQGVESFFGTQRILLDLAMRQNAAVMNLLRDRLSDPHHSPAAILTELTGEGMSNFIEAQKVLLGLAQHQNDIVMAGIKERISDSNTAVATTELLRRSVDTFIDMQQEFLKIASKQTTTWLEAAKAGKPYKGEHFVDLARESIEKFVHAQKQFLDVIAEETSRATGGKHKDGAGRKIKKTELSALARQATDSFLEAEKKLFDLAGRQMKVNLKAAGETIETLKPFSFAPLADLTREGVKSFVDAKKALTEVVVKRHNGIKHEKKTVRRRARAAHTTKKETVHAAKETAHAPKETAHAATA